MNDMETVLTADASAMGRYAATHAAEHLRNAIAAKGSAAIIVATGASQFEVLDHLVQQPGIDWTKVHGFHLDEYVGLDDSHPASFCRYLKERFVERVPLASFHYLDGSQDAKSVVKAAAEAISQVEIDVAMVGIGENAHLAFNDPPADFETTDPYLIVELDEACRRQQVGEGWFASLDEVPTQAISMSVQQILKSKAIYCSVPDARKAEAVKRTLCDPIDPSVPASILRQHAGTTLVIDEPAASQLLESVRESLRRDD
jgi:glucosamine-6-phosphate deaminase